MWQRLGLQGVVLQINSLGTPQARKVYRDALVEYLGGRFDELDADSKRRLESNPLRILDTKNPEMQAVVAAAPAMPDYLDDESRRHFADLLAMLDAAGIAYQVNPRLVRGLDYYTRTVFEWVTDRLGAQGTICAGGRFDGLVEYLGGRPTPGFGFAVGLERLLALLQATGASVPDGRPHVYLVLVGEQARRRGLVLADELRDALPGMRIESNCDGGSFKSQFKRADRSGARFALVLGDDEVEQSTATLKPLRSGADQEVLQQSGIAAHLQDLLAVRAC